MKSMGQMSVKSCAAVRNCVVNASQLVVELFSTCVKAAVSARLLAFSRIVVTLLPLFWCTFSPYINVPFLQRSIKSGRKFFSLRDAAGSGLVEGVLMM
jgi:hypothetical protein